MLSKRPALFIFLLVMTGLATLGLVHKGQWREPLATPRSEREKDMVEKLLSEFGMNTGLCLLVIEGEELFTPEPVAAMRALVAALEKVPGVDRVLSIDSVPHFESALLPQAILPGKDADESAFARGRERAMVHPLLAGRLISRDGATWLLPILIDKAEAYEHYQREPEFIFADGAQQALASVALPSAMRASLTGSEILSEAIRKRFEYEQVFYHSIAYGTVFLLAAFLFRGFWAVILAGGGPVLGVFWSFGLLRLFDVELNGLTRILLPVMVMMIGFTDSVHVMVHLRHKRSAGLTPLESARSAVQVLFMPCFLTSLTTGLGFLSLLLARTEMVRDFGFACFVGVSCTFLSVMSFLPFFASTFIGKYLTEGKPHPAIVGVMPGATRLLQWTLRNARAITVGGCVLTIAALFYGRTLETENRLSADFPTSSQAAKALVRIDQALGGWVPLSLMVSWNPEQAPEEATRLAAIRAARATLDGEVDIGEPFDVSNLLQAMPGKDSDLSRRIPLLRLIPQRLREHYYRPDAGRAHIKVHMADRGHRYYEGMYERIANKLAELPQSFPGFTFSMGGQALLYSRIYRQFTEDLVNSLALAAVTIFAVLTLAFRSIRLGLISVVPNVLPLAATAALLVFCDLPMAGATAFVMSLGIAVDDTIHFVCRFRQEFARDRDLDAAIGRTYYVVGKALIMTSLVLVVGFSPVLTSDFHRNQVFAGMICLSVTAALIGDLLLLPAMLKTFGAGTRLNRG